MSSAATPQTIGKYRVVGVLGQGAMGLVYRGEDEQLNRQVALKVITGEDVTEEMRARFQVEARAAAALDHPNIVVVYDLGEHQGMPYIAMELLKGEDLRAHVRRNPTLSPRDIAQVVVQICEGLAYAHERRIVHRDIKPANIHVLPDGRVKIMDFGVAKVESTALTKTGMVIGTPDYMSPEQIQGRAVDQRSDIFSVGVVFYELLTRSKPFSAESITSVIYNIVFKTPQSFSEMHVPVPPAVERIVAKAMAKDLADRYPDIREMAADLRRYLSGQPDAAPASDETAALPREVVARAGASATGTVARTARLEPASGPGPATVAPTVLAAGPPRKRSPALWIGLGAAALVAAGVAGLLLLKKDAPPPVAPAVASVGVEVLVTPWAQVDGLERLGESAGRVEVPPATVTPVRLELPPGRYRMAVSNPLLGATDTVDFEVGLSSTRVVHVLRGFDPAEAMAGGWGAP